ncbi:hypothetical protein DMZ48_14145 [Robertkochia solimangrovi]|nr:hypothetical protein DMZ48_14145 [Robertkochia solimangrovi]
MLKNSLKVILFSFLVFCSTSFLTVINHLTSPINETIGYKSLEIGFPFKYYEEFMIDCPNPNYGWNLNYLIFDIILTVIIVSGIKYLINKKNVLQHRL